MQAEQRQLTAKYDRALAKGCLEEKAVTEFARKATHPMAPSMPQTQTALCPYTTQIAAYPAGVGLHDSMSSACATAKDSPHWATCVAEAARLGEARRAEQLALLPPQATAKCTTAQPGLFGSSSSPTTAPPPSSPRARACLPASAL
ncbi:hypothetical protein M885DRAFT_573012 [Pelagophyceae sp. CCMP2097]|nr:hypothetical protein M885DRAFT_573012 [Pelagophyceae sp. CCMP2097]